VWRRWIDWWRPDAESREPKRPRGFAPTLSHSEPIDLAELLDQVRATIQRFIVCAPATATAATLWIAFTWIIEHVQVAPLAIITVPEKRCGKTQFLELIGRLSKRPCPSRISHQRRCSALSKHNRRRR
jgi:putative DNA primase/helicase